MEYVAQQIDTLTSTNAPELFPLWSSSTTYSLETDNENLTSASVVRYGYYYYRSLTNSNLDNNPEETLNVYWVKWDVSNAYAMVDMSSSSQSFVDAGDLTVEFVRGTIDTLGIGNVEAQEITIEQLDGLGVVIPGYTQVLSLSVNDDVIDTYSYMYSEYSDTLQRSIMVKINQLGTKIRVTFTKRAASSRSACGYLIGGQAIGMGDTTVPVNFSFRSFAVKDLDDFGTLTITRRNVQDIVDFETIVPANLMSVLKYKIKSIYNDIVLFIVDEQEDSIYGNMLTLGVIENASVVVSNNVQSYMSWSIMESV